MMPDFFERIGSSRPSQDQLQDQRRRSGQQPEIDTATTTAIAALFEPPIGAVIEWAGFGVPSAKYRTCLGQTFPIEVLPELNTALEGKWNNGTEPPGHFRLPNLTSTRNTAYVIRALP